MTDEGRAEAEQAGAGAGNGIREMLAGPGDDFGADERVPGWRSWMRDLVVSVAVSAFIILFLYQPVRVEGTSMLPSLEDQDRLFINKIAYRVGDIHRGDVVVFQYPRDHAKSYIKRVIALPGDDVRIDRGQVYVNGKALDETYVPLQYSDDKSMGEIVLPPRQYFVLGDHRSIASDSRDFGPVDRDLIYGKAVFVYWPMEQVGVVR
jgi:signal peptidase I